MLELKEIQKTEGPSQLWTKAKAKVYKALWESFKVSTELDQAGYSTGARAGSVCVASLANEPDKTVTSVSHNNRTLTDATTTHQEAYPTEAKEIAKAKKKDGYVAKKKI